MLFACLNFRNHGFGNGGFGNDGACHDCSRCMIVAVGGGGYCNPATALHSMSCKDILARIAVLQMKKFFLIFLHQIFFFAIFAAYHSIPMFNTYLILTLYL